MTQLLVKATSAFSSLLYREEGQALVEYAIILALISVAAVGLLRVMGSDVSGMFSKVVGDFN
jgi:Flp pilus assembly pilin Flp